MYYMEEKPDQELDQEYSFSDRSRVRSRRFLAMLPSSCRADESLPREEKSSSESGSNVSPKGNAGKKNDLSSTSCRLCEEYSRCDLSLWSSVTARWLSLMETTTLPVKLYVN